MESFARIYASQIVKGWSKLHHLYLPPKQAVHLGILPNTIPSATFRINSSLLPDIDCKLFFKASFNF
jgi:hypothetical protein